MAPAGAMAVQVFSMFAFGKAFIMFARMIAVTVLVASMAASAAFAQSLMLGTKLELNTLDPHFFNAFPTGSSLSMIYEALVNNDETRRCSPRLRLDGAW